MSYHYQADRITNLPLVSVQGTLNVVNVSRASRSSRRRKRVLSKSYITLASSLLLCRAPHAGNNIQEADPTAVVGFPYRVSSVFLWVGACAAKRLELSAPDQVLDDMATSRQRFSVQDSDSCFRFYEE